MHEADPVLADMFEHMLDMLDMLDHHFNGCVRISTTVRTQEAGSKIDADNCRDGEAFAPGWKTKSRFG
jgi:hypothetical protein